MRKTWNTPAGTIYHLYRDILQQPHTLIAGATGSGKSVMLNGLIYTSLYCCPGNTDLVLIDPKRVELYNYRTLPHTLKYACEAPETLETLEKCVALMEYRYKKMQSQRLVQSQDSNIYIFVDEFADLMTTDKKSYKPLLCRIAQLGRAANIHLIIATQRPTRDIVDGQIKINIDSRIALRCPTAQDSRNIINIKGAETLPRYGYGYYLTPDTMQPILYQIPMIPDTEIDRVITHWTKQNNFRWKRSHRL